MCLKTAVCRTMDFIAIKQIKCNPKFEPMSYTARPVARGEGGGCWVRTNPPPPLKNHQTIESKS